MMEIAKENFYKIGIMQRSKTINLIKQNKLISILIISLILFSTINAVLIYSFIKTMQYL